MSRWNFVLINLILYRWSSALRGVGMNLSVKELTEKNAMELCQWRYEPPYDIYNLPDWGTVKKENWGMANEEKRKHEFHAIYSSEALVGFFRLVKKEDHIMLGLGLCPDLCGKGVGRELIGLILTTAKEKYGTIKIQLEVRAFNVRAIKCYQTAGFVAIDQFSRNTPASAGDFIAMEF